MCSFLFHPCYWTRASCDLFFSFSIDEDDFFHFEDTIPPAMQNSRTGIYCVNYAWAQHENESEFWQHLNLGSKGAQISC